jgi:hypothetical protein
MTNEPIPQTNLTKTIPSYLYQQYQDDDALQAFVMAYNDYTQAFVDWFNALNLPDYTGDNITGALLDWVAQGLYGYARPLFQSGRFQTKGPIDTWAYDSLAFNDSKKVGTTQLFVTNDDIFKRCITWNFYKGDGDLFNVRWLKRRILRFILGSNGKDIPNDTQYRISVGFGDHPVVIIVNGVRRVTGGAKFDDFTFNSKAYDEVDTVFTPLTDPPFDLSVLSALQLGIETGVLQLPFQLFHTQDARLEIIIGSYDGQPVGQPQGR